jgi:3-deoxy-7-phosphoheptulonate synthase
MSASLDEFLLAAEYVMDGGNERVVLCERGIRTFSDHSRYTLDLSVVPLLKRLTHLPVFVDPSHASGLRESVAPLARAAVAAGADGVMVEVHPDPGLALCDGPQSLLPEEFAELAAEIRALAATLVARGETVS